MRVSISGSASIPEEQLADATHYIRRTLRTYANITVLSTGGAYHVDTIAAYAGLEFWPRTCKHQLVYPAEQRFNYELLGVFREGGHTLLPVQGSYMDRNSVLAKECERLLAFPPTTKESLRGGPGAGTWSTIRRARNFGKYISIFPLDGSDPWSEEP